MDYTCQIYGSAGISYLKKLDTVHHFALRTCSGAFRTYPTFSLYVDCVEPPLCLIREWKSLQFYYRILSHPHHPLHTHILTKEHEILYENRASCITKFGIRVKNILSASSLLGTKVRPRLLFNRLLGTSKAFHTSNRWSILTRPTQQLIFVFNICISSLSVT